MQTKAQDDAAENVLGAIIPTSDFEDFLGGKILLWGKKHIECSRLDGCAANILSLPSTSKVTWTFPSAPR